MQIYHYLVVSLNLDLLFPHLQANLIASKFLSIRENCFKILNDVVLPRFNFFLATLPLPLPKLFKTNLFFKTHKVQQAFTNSSCCFLTECPIAQLLNEFSRLTSRDEIVSERWSSFNYYILVELLFYTFQPTLLCKQLQ